MSKQIEKLKKQLFEISDVVNAFKFEAVQVKVIDRLLDTMIDWEKEGDGADTSSKRIRQQTTSNRLSNGERKPGATKVLNQLIHTEFFDEARSIADVANYCKDEYDADFKTSELSGILLKLANESKLKRERNNDNNRYEYVKA
jgi:hypothetical protein